jgi:hypothetical protein
MQYSASLSKIKKSLSLLNENAKHAIEFRETFSFPAYDEAIRDKIKGTSKVHCYRICMIALYFEFVMALMRMFDNHEETASFKTLFGYLSDDFIKYFETETNRKVKSEIQSALIDYNKLNGSHLLGRLKTVRHNMFAHTSMNFNKKQIAEYGYAEKLLDKTLPMLNKLNLTILGKLEPFDALRVDLKLCVSDFWQSTLNKSQ